MILLQNSLDFEYTHVYYIYINVIMKVIVYNIYYMYNVVMYNIYNIEGRKMSKSLKNFISIRSYLESKLTSNPPDDLRLYCLQYKYQATLTYSIDRITEAANYRMKIENFLFNMDVIMKYYDECNSKINNISDSKYGFYFYDIYTIYIVYYFIISYINIFILLCREIADIAFKGDIHNIIYTYI